MADFGVARVVCVLPTMRMLGASVAVAFAHVPICDQSVRRRHRSKRHKLIRGKRGDRSSVAAWSEW
eukprot:scaffold4232_cov215-Amphora_coffeaeformis.AAC.1